MRALLLVDIQNDFMPFGSLPVPHGDEVVGVANRLATKFEIVIATQDWHPPDHGSFASSHPGHVPGDMVDLAGVDQVLWPEHCVQETPGASFHSALDITRIQHVVRKGTDRDIDSYSAFYDNAHRKDTRLRELLSDRGVHSICIAGVATDYCVKYTALDGRASGIDVSVVIDGVRAVNLSPNDGEAAVAEMRQAGCTILHESEVI